MKRIISLIIASALLILSLPAYAIDNTYSETVNNTVSGYVSNISGDIEVVSQSKTPSIYVDENDYVGVLHAVDNLKSDIKTVTDVEVTGASDFQSADIVIGTIGKSATIDELIANDEIDVSKIENQWEAFTIQNVNGKLIIVGADKRGTIYGIYDFSEKMGMSLCRSLAFATSSVGIACFNAVSILLKASIYFNFHSRAFFPYR